MRSFPTARVFGFKQQLIYFMQLLVFPHAAEVFRLEPHGNTTLSTFLLVNHYGYDYGGCVLKLDFNLYSSR